MGVQHHGRRASATPETYSGIGPKFTNLERDEKRKIAAKLERRGYSHAAIGEVIGVSGSCVSNYLKKVKQHFIDSMVEDRGALVQQKLQQLKEVTREAWEAWDRSKKDKQRVLEEEITSNGFLRSKTGSSLQGQHGDVRFLNIILECIRQERDMLGLDAPKKVEATVQTLDWSQLVKGLPVGKAVTDEVEDIIHDIVTGVATADGRKVVEVIEEKPDKARDTITEYDDPDVEEM